MSTTYRKQSYHYNCITLPRKSMKLRSLIDPYKEPLYKEKWLVIVLSFHNSSIIIIHAAKCLWTHHSSVDRKTLFPRGVTSSRQSLCMYVKREIASLSPAFLRFLGGVFCLAVRCRVTATLPAFRGTPVGFVRGDGRLWGVAEPALTFYGYVTTPPPRVKSKSHSR